MSIKKIASTGLLSLSLTGIPFLAHAELRINNHSNSDSTAVINNGTCSSSALGAAGITEAHSTNTVSDFIIWYTCRSSPHDCRADVYMTRDCYASGASKVASVVFDTQIGIKSIDNFSDKYLISGSGFSIDLSDISY